MESLISIYKALTVKAFIRDIFRWIEICFFVSWGLTGKELIKESQGIFALQSFIIFPGNPNSLLVHL